MLFCPHCQRKYQRKIYFERHTAVCEVLCKTKKERLLEVEERSDTPSVRDLYLVVMEMTVKYNQLEQKYQELAKLVNVKKQKLDIGDWLNTTYVDVKAYTSWFDDIRVSRDDLETLFQSDYVNGVVKVLRKCLPLEDELRPIRAYTTKDNVFYYYDQKNKWSVIDSDVYNKLMHLLDKKFMSEFLKWQNENRDRLHLDDFSLIYAKNVKKIMATREQLYSRIKKELYQYLKTDLPSVMEYVIT